MKIVTLTLAPAFDIHCDAEAIVADHENIADITEIDAGGKGVNISRALDSFGVPNTAIVVLGNENSREFEGKLEKEGLRFEKIEFQGRIRENITIHTAGGKETRISFRGDAVPDDLIDRVRSLTDLICDDDTVLTFTGRVPEGVSMESAKRYIKELKARGVRVVLDSRSFSLADMLEVAPYLIKPNEEEISAYVGREISDFDSAAVAARELCERGIENVMISLGEKGALVCSAGEIYTAKAPRINAVSTVGAGDSSIAGFLCALGAGKKIFECLKYAVAFGSAACLIAGTKAPKRSDIEALL